MAATCFRKSKGEPGPGHAVLRPPGGNNTSFRSQIPGFSTFEAHYFLFSASFSVCGVFCKEQQPIEAPRARLGGSGKDRRTERAQEQGSNRAKPEVF